MGRDFDHRHVPSMPLVNELQGEYFVPDDFEQVVAEGMAPKESSHIFPSEFGKLCRGQTIGKRAIIIDEGNVRTVQESTARVDFFTLKGRDEDAMSLCITLAPPKVVLGVFNPNDQDTAQRITGERGVQSPDESATVLGNVIGMVAMIEFGIGGVSTEAEVDFTNGARFSVQASYVRMRAKMLSMGIASFNPAAYVLGAFIGPDNGLSRQAKRTIFTEAVGGVGVGTIVRPVPAFASDVCPMQVTTVAVTFDLVFFADSAGTIEVGRQRYVFNGAPVGFEPKRPVPGGAYYWRLISQVATPPDLPGIPVIFNLSL